MKKITRNLLLDALEGSQYIHDVNRGDISAPNKERLDFAKFAIDRLDFSPNGKCDPGKAILVNASATARAIDLSSISNDDLERIERDLAEQSRRGQPRAPGHR